MGEVKMFPEVDIGGPNSLTPASSSASYLSMHTSVGSSFEDVQSLAGSRPSLCNESDYNDGEIMLA